METTNFESQNPIPDIQIPVLPSTPTPNKKIFKILFFIFLSLFLIISSIYVYFWVKSDKQTQNQITENVTPIATQIPTLIPTVTDETQNWKTYTDVKHKISFKYPQNWVISNSEEGIFLKNSTTSNMTFYFLNELGRGFEGINKVINYDARIVNNTISLSKKTEEISQSLETVNGDIPSKGFAIYSATKNNTVGNYQYIFLMEGDDVTQTNEQTLLFEKIISNITIN